MLFRSIIDAFFIFKVLLISKNLFRLINESADTTLTSQMSAVKSSRGNFERHRGY